MDFIDAAAGFLLHSMQMQQEGVPIVACTSGESENAVDLSLVLLMVLP